MKRPVSSSFMRQMRADRPIMIWGRDYSAIQIETRFFTSSSNG